MELDGSDVMELEVDAEQLSDDGTLELIPLDDEGRPLGTYAVDTKAIAVPDAGSAWDGIGPVLLWILVGVLGIGVAAALYLILRKKNAPL